MTTSEEWATVNIRYKQPDQNTSDLLNYPVDSSAYSPNMSENMKLAAAICEFGMLLKNSEYAGTASFDSVRDILLAIHDLEQDSYISELLQMVTDVKTLE